MTETTTDTRTAVQELRTAAAKLHKVAGADPLYAPLASLLDVFANVYEAVEIDTVGTVQALAVARAINGTAS